MWFFPQLIVSTPIIKINIDMDMIFYFLNIKVTHRLEKKPVCLYCKFNPYVHRLALHQNIGVLSRLILIGLKTNPYCLNKKNAIIVGITIIT